MSGRWRSHATARGAANDPPHSIRHLFGRRVGAGTVLILYLLVRYVMMGVRVGAGTKGEGVNAGASDRDWYYAKTDTPSGQQAGPFGWEQLRSLALAGAIAPTDLVWHPSLPQWVPAAQIGGLFPVGAFRPAQPAAPSVAPPRPPNEWVAGMATGPFEAPPAPLTPAPARRPRPWLLPVIISLAALLLVGGGLGVYFGFIRDRDDSPATTTTLAGTETTSATTPGVTTGPGGTTVTTLETAGTTGSTVPTARAAAWFPVDPVGQTPSPRMSHAMAYDARAGAVIMFGGVYLTDEDIIDYDDTWAFDTSTGRWTDLAPAGALPPARDSHAMAYDPDTEQIILFGGVSSYGEWLDDTWAYDTATNSWFDLAPPGARPLSRMGHALAYDPVTRQTILFGGIDDIDTYFGDTWAYDFATNSWLDLNPAGQVPTGRYGHTMVYDADTGRVLLFGGWGNDGNFSDTWAYDPQSNTWAELDPGTTGPANRAGQSMVYDTARGRAILIGGWGDDVFFGDTWAFDSAAGRWDEVDQGGAGAPEPRGLAAAAYDPATGSTVLFGGYDGDIQFGDTWVYGVNSR